MDTTPQVIPAPARREFSLGFKLVVFSAFCALVGQPVHFIDAANFDLYFGLWFFTLLFGLIGISVWHAFTRRLPMPKWMRGSHGVPLDTKSAESPRCSQCNYDLRSITTHRCPECGWPTDRQRTELWWSHRKET